MNLTAILLFVYHQCFETLSAWARLFCVAWPPNTQLLARLTLVVSSLIVYPTSVNAEQALGPLSWVTVLCKYANVDAEPASVSAIDQMFGDEPAQLNHYWKANSYGKSSLDGSQTFGWYRLPSDKESYFSAGEPDTIRLVSDCVEAADPDINFSDFYGINVFLNDVWQSGSGGSGSGGKGGSLVLDVDGQSIHRFTALGSNSWSNQASIVHEMGHGLGLRHPNNFDMDDDPYDNPWSVMSGAYIDAAYDLRYGYLAKHFNAFEKETLGWFDSSEIYTLDLNELSLGSSQSIQLDFVGAAHTDNYRMLKLIGGDSDDRFYYTVEARERDGLYDGGLKSSTVLIHEVDLETRRSAWVVDADSPAADVSNNDGSMWTPGETYRGEGFEIKIIQRTATGYKVNVTANNGSVGDNSVPFLRPINLEQELSVDYLFQLYFHPVDPDGFAPGFFASGMPANAVLKRVADDTWLFEWTPTRADIGLTTVVFQVQDAVDATVGSESVVNLYVSQSVLIDHGPTSNSAPGRPEQLLGNVPWVTLLCRFSDITQTQATRSFVQELFGDSFGQINHWWKTASYGRTDITGSIVLGWYDLPKPRSAYIGGALSEFGINSAMLTNDCVDVANDDVDFSRFYGVNTFFNGPFNSEAAGFGKIRTIEADNAGLMATTAIAAPYWTYHTAVIHEMGLAVGLPRSNNSDMDDSTFDSPWTNMSDGRGYSVRDLRYEYLAKHLNAFEKHSLGWLQESEVLELDVNDLMANPMNIVLAPISAASTDHYRAIILTDRQRSPAVFYTIEARERGAQGSYDASLPGTAIVVHEVDLRRGQPAWSLADLSATTQVADYAYTANDMWIVGEVLQLPRVTVSVKSRHITEGFRLGIQTGLERGNIPTSVSVQDPLDDLREDPLETPLVVTEQTLAQPSLGGYTDQGGNGSGALGWWFLLGLFSLFLVRVLAMPWSQIIEYNQK